MSHYPGKFIVIDGTDGSGKTTQLQLLAGKLANEGYEVELADFPQYNSKSAGMVEEYLSGKYGEADSVNPYAASLLYSVDRFDASFQIREWLQAGKIVISNRYISSSFAHQGGKIDNPLERKLFFNWLSEIEYKIFKIPKPDLYLILHVEAEISQKLAKDRQREDWKGKTKDIHEDNLDHLKKAENIYLEIAQNMPDFRLIKCTRDGEIMKREDISYLIWLYVKRVFNIDESKKKKPDFQAVGDILIKNGKLSPQLIEKDENSRSRNGSEDARRFSNYSLEEEVAMELKKIEDKSEQEQKQYNNIPEIKIEKITSTAKLPTRAHLSDAGLDLYATENISIPPYGQGIIPTGLKIAIPESYVGLIWDKSGLASQGYTTLGGVIDAGYRGEIKVIFKNLSEDICHIQEGQKIAQLLIQKIENPHIKEASVEDNTERGESRFGSTGLI